MQDSDGGVFVDTLGDVSYAAPSDMLLLSPSSSGRSHSPEEMSTPRRGKDGGRTASMSSCSDSGVSSLGGDVVVRFGGEMIDLPSYTELRSQDFLQPLSDGESDIHLQFESVGNGGGYLETVASLGDLQSILDAAGPQQPQQQQQHQQQQQQQPPPRQLPHQLQLTPVSGMLTPDATPEGERLPSLEWTYLEPIPQQHHLIPTVIETSTSTSSSALPSSALSPPTPVTSPPSSFNPLPPGRWQIQGQQREQVLAVKTEPQDYYSLPDEANLNAGGGLLRPAAVQAQQQVRPQKSQPRRRATSRAAAPKRPPKEPATVRPCHVCGETAGKHSYYGGQVCPSCRAFFRRSVQSR